MLRKAFIFALCCCLAGGVSACAEHHASAVVSSAVSGDSLFQLKTPLTNQQGQKFELGSAPAKLTVVTMFYGDCNVSCPIVLENIKRTLAAVPNAHAASVHALMISLNPGVDTPKSLAGLAKVHEFDVKNATLAVSDNDAQTRKLAAALGVKYRRGANGEINHNTRFVLLDQQGRIVASSDTLSVEPDPVLMKAIHAQLANK
ncbi:MULTISPECIES: SCO family protein [Deefgea]|uniref:SCO family protein n=1 Tax=Deefgea chitinilytica TaxID=570276 RepID=A0ABS2CDP5_9NEIS|nr:MULTISPECIES: SCO family protein [Deefgea]MBM5572255.1 SCO family protein [Deefgea chitinilytica]MBM9889490.1 SCO family protein [Deefgea sp. CFH1-16]